MKDAPIGFFDSGIGGITVLGEALKQLPCENYIYYADTDHVPYGTKDKAQVKQYIFEAVEFLVSKKIKALVVACNTATSIAVRELRGMYDFPIVGMEPAVKPAVQKENGSGKRVLVFATPLTLQEEKFHNLVQRVDQEHVVDYLPFPELVECAEKNIFDDETMIPIITNKLKNYDMRTYKTIVLGCTHFPIYRSTFEKILPEHIDIIDGSSGTIRYLKRLLEEADLLGSYNNCPTPNTPYNVNIDFYCSGKQIKEPNHIKTFYDILERVK